MENTITTTVSAEETMSIAMGVSTAAYADLQADLGAIRATVGELDTAIDGMDAAESVWRKAVSKRNTHWDDPDGDRAALADVVKTAQDALQAAQDAVEDKKGLLKYQCDNWDKKSLSARLDYIADQGIAEWLRLPKVYRVGVKTVKAGDSRAMIAYTQRTDLKLSALPRNPIVDRMVQAIRADIRAIYAEQVAYKTAIKPIDRAGLPDCYAVADPLSNGRLAKMLLAVMDVYGMPIDAIHNGTARIFRDGAKSTNVKGQTTERSISDLIDEIGYMAINVHDGTPFTWRNKED